MKFDKIIMNPPYKRNLHLKILSEAIQYLNKDGECINLSPIRWLQDPMAKFKRNTDVKRYANIIKHIDSIEEIHARTAVMKFENGITITIGIYKLLEENTDFNLDSMLNQIALRILNKLKEIPIIEKNKQDGWRVRIPMITSGDAHGGRPSSKI